MQVKYSIDSSALDWDVFFKHCSEINELLVRFRAQKDQYSWMEELIWSVVESIQIISA